MIKPQKLPYENTHADPEKTKAEIISLLKKFGITDYAWSEQMGQPRLLFKTDVDYEGHRKEWNVLSNPPILAREKRVYDEHERRLVKKPIPMYAVSYRLFLNHLKAKLTMVAIGASKFEEEFFADLAVQTPEGPKRLVEVAKSKPQLAASLGLPQLEERELETKRE